ncbi:metal ABC transporter solute-binding protein, Zn/Mn family [Rossellomorea aquimaris]|uniref:Adhesin n=1 Tax=Rossellomorea aquimaris TaxID=189382 RepID=A0A1J6VW49_9BACI|nr:zinc ABC transporter substrate-binding protein [Rossellomorea aquimaris]OIU68604.1 adhesin [Rossellomorea aquimaris]
MKKNTLLTLISTLVILTACQNESSTLSSENEPISIKTSIYPLHYFAERIGEDQVKVSTLLPPGSDAHTFEPTPKDMIEIAESDLFIYNGLGMESYSSKIAKALKSEDALMVEATEGADVISSSHGHKGEQTAGEEGVHDEHGDGSHEEEAHDKHSDGDYDPHIWLDPTRADQLAANIRDALIKEKPEEKKNFEKNYQELVKDLNELDREMNEVTSEKDHPEILVSHAAYGYWEDTYKIEQLAVAGLSPTDEPSQKELKEIIETANKHGLKYVIFEQNVTPRVAKIVQDEMKAEPLRIHNLSVLTEEDIEKDKDYLSLMKENIETLKKALE